jgi:arsenate reductase (glutaredoxin)
MTPVLYGIPNCDTVKKARIWLDAHNIAYRFHDYKKAGTDAGLLLKWCEIAGWDVVLNRAGTTFKKLGDADRAGLTVVKAVTLMCAQPSMIKRPIVEHAGGLLVGFKLPEWEDAFGQ